MSFVSSGLGNVLDENVRLGAFGDFFRSSVDRLQFKRECRNLLHRNLWFVETQTVFGKQQEAHEKRMQKFTAQKSVVR